MKYYTLYDWSSHLEMVLNGNTLFAGRIHIQQEARCEITYYSASNNRFVFMTSFLAMLRHLEGHRLSGDP